MAVKYFILLSFFCVSAVNTSKYPIPDKVDGLLFYIQRSNNKNTIVYKANFKKDGMLNPSNPVNAYWIMYEKGGRKENLTLMEKKYAYGMIIEPCTDKTNAYWLKLVSQKSLPLRIEQQAPFKAKIYIKRKDVDYQLDHIFIKADNSSFWPKVENVELFMSKHEQGDIVSEIIKM